MTESVLPDYAQPALETYQKLSPAGREAIATARGWNIARFRQLTVSQQVQQLAYDDVNSSR